MIQRVLGTGTNGTVYLVSALANGNLYALKMGAYNRTLQAEIKLLFLYISIGKKQGKIRSIVIYMMPMTMKKMDSLFLFM